MVEYVALFACCSVVFGEIMLYKSSLLSSASGSLNGTTFSRNRYGSYTRNRTNPVNPNSARQQSARADFASAVNYWSTLSDAERSSWNSYAAATPVQNKVGDTVYLSGFASFVGSNSFFLQVGASMVSAAPSTPGSSTLGNITVVTIDEASDYDLTITTTGNTALSYWLVQIGFPIGNGVTFYGGPYTLFYVDATVPSTGLSAVSVTYAGGQWGLPATGQRRAVRIRGIDSEGKLSNAFQTIVTIG